MLLLGFVSAQAGVVNHSIAGGTLTILGTSGDDYIITGSTTSNYVVIQAGYQGTVTLNNVSISGATPIRVYGENNRSNSNPITKVTVIIQGSNVIQGTNNSNAAFQVDQGAQIHIRAVDPVDNTSGSLTVMAYTATTTGAGSSGSAAAIGAGNVAQGKAVIYNSNGTVLSSSGNTSGGNVIISSGTIVANGGYHGAGIGGCHSSGQWYNGMIVIYGGIVTSRGGGHSAGIGTGCPQGSGNNGTYAADGVIIAIPPAQITATTTQSGKKGLAGAARITYIGDPESPLITVYTQDYERNADIYADLTETTSITSVFNTLAIDYDLSRVKFGTTKPADGKYTINGTLVQPVTVFTDASSSQTATLGRPYKPQQVTVTSATNVMLPLLNINMSLEATPSTPMEVGYNSGQAAANAYKLKITYSDTKSMTGVTFGLQSGATSDFTGLNFYGSDGTSSISAPTELNSGMVFYIHVPIKTGKSINIYRDVLRFSGTWDGSATGFIRQVVTQRIVYDDTNTNTYIKVTASPGQFITNNAGTASATLTLNISHSGLTIPYDPTDVTARYLVSTYSDYAAALAANPLGTWSVLTPPTTDGGSIPTTVSFSGKPENTYYIHWYVTSGTVYAHSKTVVGPPPATYGGFGPYIIDATAPTVALSIDGTTTAKTFGSNAPLPVILTFNEAVKNPGTDLTVSDFDIVVAGKAAISGIAVVPASDDKRFTATLTPANNLYNGENFTVKLKAGAVTDMAGNNSAVSNTVTLTYTNTVKPTVTFNTAAAYSTLRPTFTVEVVPGDFASNGNTDLYQTAGGAVIINSTNLASLFTVTPEGGTALTSGYSATYTKNGSGTSAKGVITFEFSTDLINSKNYTVVLATNKLFNLAQNGNDAGTATFMIAEPDFTDVNAGISVEPNILASDGGSVTLVIKGKGLKMNAEAGLLSLRVTCPAIGYDSGPITTGFVVESGMDKVSVPDVSVPANTGSTTLTHIFSLYRTFNSTEMSTGKICQVQVEPAMSYIVKVVNLTASANDLTYGYTTGDAQATGRIQHIQVTNNGAQVLNSLTVSFNGPDGEHFTGSTPLPSTGLAPGGVSTFSVYLKTGKHAGVYAGGGAGSETKVMVTATPASSSPLNGSAALVQQKVIASAITDGTEARVTGNPTPSLNVMTQNSILLTTSVITSGDQLKNWKYAVSSTNVRPADSDPVWTAVGGGTPTASHTFPNGTLGSYYIFYEINTNDYTGIKGQVEDGAVKVYNVDLVPPAVSSIVPARSVTNATPFTAIVTFSEPVGDMDASKFVATGATIGSLTPTGIPVDGLYSTYQITVTPVSGLVNDDVITISVQEAAGKDRATNPNTPSGIGVNATVTFNSTNPLVTLTTPDLTVNSNFTVTATFTKPIFGLEESEIVVSSSATVQTGSLTPASGNGQTFDFVINTAGISSGIITISIPAHAVVDAANNENEEGALSVDYRDAADKIAGVLTYTGPTYENGPFNVNVQFSRVVTGLSAADFSY
ncbi:MAG: hypothetical protein LBJ23_02490, partial [Tannerella sp.]|nr:hypothetical protein [Tannerella sp.]